MVQVSSSPPRAPGHIPALPMWDTVAFQPFSALRISLMDAVFSSEQTNRVPLRDGLFCSQSKEVLHQQMKPTQRSAPSLLGSVWLRPCREAGLGLLRLLFGPLSPRWL